MCLVKEIRKWCFFDPKSTVRQGLYTMPHVLHRIAKNPGSFLGLHSFIQEDDCHPSKTTLIYLVFPWNQSPSEALGAGVYLLSQEAGASGLGEIGKVKEFTSRCVTEIPAVDQWRSVLLGLLSSGQNFPFSGSPERQKVE